MSDPKQLVSAVVAPPPQQSMLSSGGLFSVVRQAMNRSATTNLIYLDADDMRSLTGSSETLLAHFTVINPNTGDLLILPGTSVPQMTDTNVDQKAIGTGSGMDPRRGTVGMNRLQRHSLQCFGPDDTVLIMPYPDRIVDVAHSIHISIQTFVACPAYKVVDLEKAFLQKLAGQFLSVGQQLYIDALESTLILTVNEVTAVDPKNPHVPLLTVSAMVVPTVTLFAIGGHRVVANAQNPLLSITSAQRLIMSRVECEARALSRRALRHALSVTRATPLGSNSSDLSALHHHTLRDAMVTKTNVPIPLAVDSNVVKSGDVSTASAAAIEPAAASLATAAANTAVTLVDAKIMPFAAAAVTVAGLDAKDAKSNVSALVAKDAQSDVSALVAKDAKSDVSALVAKDAKSDVSAPAPALVDAIPADIFKPWPKGQYFQADMRVSCLMYVNDRLSLVDATLLCMCHYTHYLGWYLGDVFVYELDRKLRDTDATTPGRFVETDRLFQPVGSKERWHAYVEAQGRFIPFEKIKVDPRRFVSVSAD